MTITVLPMDATAGTPAYTAQHARQSQAALYGNPTGRVFGTRSGWRVGTLSSIVSVTSTTWTLNPSACMIEPAAQLYQGAYGWASDQVITGPVTAADGTNPRIDILYIQVNDSSAGDGSGGLSANVSYLAGVAAPSGTQVAPALPPRSFLVATIAVPKSGAGSPTVTLNKAYFVAAGGLLPVLSQADRDSLTPYPGLSVYRLDFPGAVELYDGTSWNPASGASVPWNNMGSAWTTTDGKITKIWTGSKWQYTLTGHLVLSAAAPFTMTTSMGAIGVVVPSGMFPNPGTVFGFGAYSDNNANYVAPVIARISTTGTLSLATVSGSASIVQFGQFWLTLTWTA